MSAPERLIEAGVLVPVFRDAAGELRLVMVRRTEGGVHGGQLAFPGGVREPDDPTLLDTAVREAEEEIGLPPSAVHPLTELPVIETFTTGFRIAPFLARIVRPGAWRLSEREIAEVLELTVRELADPGLHAESLEHFPSWSEPRVIPFVRVGEHRLWGASYRIVRLLLPRLIAGEWEL